MKHNKILVKSCIIYAQITLVSKQLKEYLVILITSFYDINRQILRYSDFPFASYELCMIMYISTAQ